MNFQNLKTIAITILIGVFASCANDHAELTRDKALLNLKQQFSKIMSLAMSATCTDATGWAFTPIGNRPCGGPDGYIIYSTSIDTVMFLKEVEAYTLAEMVINNKWPSGGTCAVPQKPSGVACINGVPVLTY